MSNIIFSSAKGRWIDKYSLPNSGDSIAVVLVQSSGLQSDATLGGYQYLSQVWGGGNLEATFTSYARKTITGTGITISTGTTCSVSLSNQVWNAAGGATNNSLGALLVCYVPVGVVVDTGIQCLSKHDFVATTTGGNLTAVITTIATAS